MNRRNFIKRTSISGLAFAGAPFFIVKPHKKAVMDRIGLTTVVFRDRFSATSTTKDNIENELSLLDIPTYFQDRFGIHNLEFWAKHFESTSAGYLKDIKNTLTKNKCQLIDIQAESQFDISDEDEEKRMKGIADMKSWIDVGAVLGSKFIRISAMNKSYEKSVESLRIINEYAKKKGVKTLVENHFDLYSNPDNQLKIIGNIKDSNFGLLADFGNYPPKTDKYEALKNIAPFTKLISAKTSDFDENMNHTSFDFRKCINIFKAANYQGIYSLEQWGKANPNYDYEKITDWMINEVKELLVS